MSYDCTSPYCSNNPGSFGTYEAYRGELCGACEAERERTHCERCKTWIGEQDERICDSCVDELGADSAWRESMAAAVE